MVDDLRRAFLEFALQQGVLRFGDFTLRSGRKSPYFFNAGLFNTGQSLGRLGRYYAETIRAAGFEFDVLFGPAYKGIPLVAATAIALAEQSGHDVRFAFDRKEEKDHGEGGAVVGGPLSGRVLIVDDVVTAGGAVDRAVERIRAAGGEPVALVVALDRMERDEAGRPALAAVAERHGLAVRAIARLDDLIALLRARAELAVHLPALERYRTEYGA